MIKLTISYSDESEFQSRAKPLIDALSSTFTIGKIRPPLSKSARKRPESEYFKRYFDLEPK